VLTLLTRLTLSLGAVLALMFFVAWVLKRRGALQSGKPGRIEVIARQSLTRTASVQVVRVGDHALVLGVTEQSVTLLAEADPAEAAAMRGFGAVLNEAEDAMGVPSARGDSETRSKTPRTASTRSDERSGPAWTAIVETLRDKTVRR